MSNTDNLSAGPEFKFLLICSGCGQADVKEKLLNLISHTLDWEKLIQITKHHRLIPQVYGAACDLGDSIHPESLQELRRLNEKNVLQTMRLTRDLIRVVKHFQACKIPVLAYKGPVLATMLYRDLTQRQYSDLDLLVHASDVQKSKDILGELGYTAELSLSYAEEKHYIGSANEYAFHAPDARNVLELQWRILPRFYSVEFDVAGFFARSVRVNVSGHPIPTLCAEDLLLVLCVHAAKHAWSELSLVKDVAKLLDLGENCLWGGDGLLREIQVKGGGQECPPYMNLIQRARTLGILRILGVNLGLAQKLFNSTPIAVSENDMAVATERVLPIVLQNQQVHTEAVSYFRLMLALRERWRDKARFLWRLLTGPSVSEWETLRLPVWLWALYRVVRIYRLTARFWRSTWGQPPANPPSEARNFEPRQTEAI